ncbi:MAG: SDR family oxidoreductase [Methylacidiphilales bacterium]|nr:SDR family oxidoreductase [Candidatus Methylacidiphilales bacterium]MDW8348838.1 SDR family oxidoreductase [Verrucomicrobiae bacterium]
MSDYPRFKNLTALITGASSGFGEEFARQLAPHTRQLILIARRRNRLESIKQTLEKHHSSLNVTVIQADLSLPNSVEHTVLPALHQLNTSPHILINNAGLGDYGTFATCPPARILAQHHVNTTALLSLTHALLPKMLAERKGFILNVGSIAGHMPLPTFALYAATKAYVNSLTLALHAELAHQGIHVSLFAPGPIPTEFRQAAQRPDAPPDAGRAPDWLTQPLSPSIQQALEALHDNRPLCTPGRTVRLIAALMRYAPHVLTLRLFRIAIPR